MDILKELLEQIMAILVPAVVAAVGLLVAFALAALKKYLDALQRKVKLQADEDMVSQVVGAVQQMYPTFSGQGKKETALEKLDKLGVKPVDADRLIEAEVGYRKRVQNGG